MNGIFETTSRRLENYFYQNGIIAKRYYKNDSYETVWVYDRTPWLEDVLEMYGRMLQMQKRRGV